MIETIDPIIPAERIESRVQELARRIEEDFRNGDLTIVLVLTGALFFARDLIRHLQLPLLLEVVKAKSYRGTESGDLRLHLELVDTNSIRGRDVLIVDDIVDTGKTLCQLVSALREWSPRTIRTAVLLNKHSRRLPESPIHPDYEGFQIPDKFVVGYGLDYDGKYRNVPFIGVVRDGS
jgi:hypoxanthine phosphoribosyltransferase